MTVISIVGLGAGDFEQLPLGVYRLLKTEKRLFLRTKEHPVVRSLESEGIHYQSFDSLYEQSDHFDETYRSIVKRILEEAAFGDLIYAVPGHPLVGERTVQLLLKEAEKNGVTINIIGGQSFLDPLFRAVGIDPIEGCQIVDATDLKKEEVQIRHHLVITQVYDRMVASDVKLTLMELLPDDYGVTVVEAAGSKEEKLVTIPLYELDRTVSTSNLTAVYVPPVRDERLLYRDFAKLKDVIATLRGPNGCPWDKEQTHESLKRYLVEETYEVLEAIDENDPDHLTEELGDLLLQVMLHAQIGEDEGLFSIDDVIFSLTGKMIRRHPHVFADANADSADDVVKHWEAIKMQEKDGKQPAPSVLDGVPKGLPALHRAYELQKKAAKTGFDWPERHQVWKKVEEELNEFNQATDDREKTAEFGDLLFALVNLARFYDIDPEEALCMTNRKFQRRFSYIEQMLQKEGKTPNHVSLERMDELWEEAKEKEHGRKG